MDWYNVYTENIRIMCLCNYTYGVWLKRESILYICTMCVHVYMYVCVCVCMCVCVYVCEGYMHMHSQEWYNICVQAYCSFCPFSALICLALVECSASEIPCTFLANGKIPNAKISSKVQCSRSTEQYSLRLWQVSAQFPVVINLV